MNEKQEHEMKGIHQDGVGGQVLVMIIVVTIVVIIVVALVAGKQGCI